jgi:protein-tyrosine-phosphatase
MAKPARGPRRRLPLYSKLREEWQIPDPKEMPPEQYRQVRDLIETKVRELLDTL